MVANMKSDLFALKPAFLPNEPIVLRLENMSDANLITMEIYHLAKKVATVSISVSPMSETDLVLEGYSDEFCGLGIKAILLIKGKDTEVDGQSKEVDKQLTEVIYTSVDISTMARRQVRYGFLSDFTMEDSDEDDIVQMLKVHINTVQFYDWSYKHNYLVSPDDSYTDMMGKHNVKTVISEKIRHCHKYSMQAFAYAPVYSADKEYGDGHPEQRLYNGAGSPIVFIDTFHIMNPACHEWRTHLLKQYRSAIVEMDFDGIHMDTYGFPKTAWDVDGSVVHLEDSFCSLINETNEIICSIKKDNKTITIFSKAKAVLEDGFAIFNNVGGWPLALTRGVEQKAVYVEVWPPNESYWNLAAIITEARQGGNRPVVLAAYPAPFRTCQPDDALESELLCSFIIAMHGATQLFFGEHACAITQGYYPDYTPLTEAQIREIRRYQDFFVQYQELFYDRTLVDVSMTHQGWDNMEYVCNRKSSATGQPNLLWLHIVENHWRKVICLVNLEQNDDAWNEGKQKPESIEDVSFSIQVTSWHPQVFYASPDDESPIPSVMRYRIEDTDRGIVLHTTVPPCYAAGYYGSKKKMKNMN